MARRAPAEVEHLIGDFAKAKEKLGWEPRTTFDVGVRAALLVPGLSVFCTVRDLFDVRGMDFTRSPLPGRRFSAAIQYRKEL